MNIELKLKKIYEITGMVSEAEKKDFELQLSIKSINPKVEFNP